MTTGVGGGETNRGQRRNSESPSQPVSLVSVMYEVQLRLRDPGSSAASLNFVGFFRDSNTTSVTFSLIRMAS